MTVFEGSPTQLSVVVPLFNEEDNVEPMLRELFDVLDRLEVSSEVICIDDGSTDRTFDRLRTLSGQRQDLVVIRFVKNYGQTSALSAGFHAARGQVVITIDGDMQNDPADIPRLLEVFDSGYDIVSGWRKKRKDAFLWRTLPSRTANWLISRITGVHLHDYGCTLKAYRGELLDRFELYGQLHRFIPALGVWAGGSVKEIEVNHRPRRRGSSKYGIGRTFTVLLDLMIVKFLMSYGSHPIRMFGMAGLLSWLGAFASLAATVYMKLVQGTDMTGNPLLYLAVLGVLVGLQFLLMGVLAEMQMRTYHEAQAKRPYVIADRIDFRSTKARQGATREGVDATAR
jgi:glycosyltransferase involved in cell wall biosynthesis